jgi:hypothetical protein
MVEFALAQKREKVAKYQSLKYTIHQLR